MLEGKAAVMQGNMNKLEELDDRGIMKFKKVNTKSCTWEIITPCNKLGTGWLEISSA